MKIRMTRFSLYFITALLVVAMMILGFGITASSQDASPTPPAAEAAADIVDTAIADGRFTTLVSAIQAAGLEETLRGPGPFTVFAPTDEAFDKLPPGTLDSLLEDTEQLEQILLYHVVQGENTAQDILMITMVDTVQGESLEIGLSVNEARVIIPDVMASNGVIHVIDTVLMPPTEAAEPAASPSPAP